MGGSGSAWEAQAQARTERDELAWAYGERRGVSMPVSEIVVPAAADE